MFCLAQVQNHITKYRTVFPDKKLSKNYVNQFAHKKLSQRRFDLHIVIQESLC